MKQKLLLVFIVLLTSIARAQVLDGIYYDNSYQSRIPSIYQTYFINTKWNDSLGLMMNDAIKTDPKKYPVFSDCILIDKNASSLFNRQSICAYYTDSGKFSMDTLMNLSIETHLDLSDFSEAFYFRKFEITNNEYREFTNWVRDSIARFLLAENGIEDYRESEYDWEGNENSKLIWKTKIEWDSKDPEYRAALDDMYLPEQERYYRRKELDTRKFIYDYTYYVKGLRYRTKVCVYPDTLVWLKDNEVNEMEPMSKLYFWHSTYDNYPVVGITWNQARAFLHWKEQRINESLQKKYPGMEIKLELPTVVEWELANSQVKDGHVESYNPWECNLITGRENKFEEELVVKVDSSAYKIEPVVYSYSNHGVLSPDIYYQDGYYSVEHYPKNKNMRVEDMDTNIFIGEDEYAISVRKWIYHSDRKSSFFNPTPLLKPDSNDVVNAYYLVSPVDLFALKDKEKINTFYKKEQTVITTRIKAKYLYKDVSFVEGNVSEWMLNDYKNWQPGFEAHMLQIENKESIDADAEFSQEMLGDYWNDKNGKLIKGSNWYHDACTQGETIDANVQRFADPDSSFSTVGFRYVVYVKKFSKK